MTDRVLAFHFDLKRPMWRRDHMNRLVARLREWGFNTVLYEFEDKLRFTHHPDLAHPEAWSHEQTVEFTQATRRETAGHLPGLLAVG